MLMMLFYTSQLVLNSGQYFDAFISYHLSLLGYITVIRNHPMWKSLFLSFFTKYRNLQNDGIGFKEVRLSIEVLLFFVMRQATHSLKSIISHNGYWHCK